MERLASFDILEWPSGSSYSRLGGVGAVIVASANSWLEAMSSHRRTLQPEAIIDEQKSADKQSLRLKRKSRIQLNFMDFESANPGVRGSARCDVTRQKSL